ncbi:Tyrosine-protein kinase ptk [bioreactor metagenome]|uniref:Tyrosine-protein kinase ptk n=1 Tax=bioreactor metagenome TaxID=1076179 RepID=A0A644VU40_9ZZZZ
MEQQHTEESIDLRAIVHSVIDNWYWYVISIVLCIAAGLVYLKMADPIFEVTSSVILKQEKSAPEEMLLLQDFGFEGGTNNIDNEIGVFKSSDLITKVVTAQEFYISYRGERRFNLFYSPELYKESPVYVRWEDIEPESIPYTVHLELSKKRDGIEVLAKFTTDGNEHSEKALLTSLPGYIDIAPGKFYITAQDSTNQEWSFIVASISNPVAVAKNISNNLSVSTSTKTSSQLEITLKTANRRKGVDFLKALIEEYNRDAVKDKNQIAYNTAVFIEERLKEISSELSVVESEVEAFQRQNEIADIPTQVAGYIQKDEGYTVKRNEIETQLNLISYIEQFISKPENKNKLIPNLGVKDPGLSAVIHNYNELLIEKSRVESASSEANPALKQMNARVDNMLQSIRASLANEKSASQIALRDMERENAVNNLQMRRLPTVSRQYNDILRQQEVKSSLFVYLLQKREETNLTQAAVAPKAKIIAKPIAGTSPVAPRKMIILLAAFMIGVIIPAGSLWVREMFKTRIENINDLNELKDISIIGDIAAVSDFGADDSRVVVKANDHSPVNEMFRTLRSNLLFMISEKDQSVILVTSTISKEGKTFVASNLAKVLSLMEKKVLLVGADIRNPQISNTMTIKKSSTGLTSYLAGITNDYHEIIEKVDEHLFVMQTGPIPPNPNELLAKPRTGDLIQRLKKEFDYVVIDSAPVGLVSDTFTIAKYADATIFVMREKFTEKDSIHFLNNLYAEKRIHNVAVVLNQTETLTRMGRYGYGYKYSYRYKYGYNNKEEKKSRWF